MKQENDNDEYMGNIWGWKISKLSAALIIILLLIMGARYWYLKSTGQYKPADKIEEVKLNPFAE